MFKLVLKKAEEPEIKLPTSAAAAKSLQSCSTLCDPIDGSPPGSPVAGILKARTLEWVTISFSNAWKWKVKAKSLSRVQLLAPHGLQPARLLRPWDFPGKSTGVGCHCLLQPTSSGSSKKQESSRKISISAFLTMPKPLTVWITITVENSERDGNTRPPDLPLEKPICRSGSNS